VLGPQPQSPRHRIARKGTPVLAMHMFGSGGGSGGNAPMMSNQHDPNSGGYADQEMGNAGQYPGAQAPGAGGPMPGAGVGGMMGPGPQQGGYAPVGGHPPPGPGGYPNQGPPDFSSPVTAPAYTRMSSTNPMNLIWFAAACSVMIGSILSFVYELMSLQWVDALEMVYLFIFGFLLAVMDTPLFNQVAIVSELRAAIGKYIAILQRVTGKGAAYVFLGCSLFSSMYANVEGGFMMFLAFLIGLFVVIVGTFSLIIAVLKSRNLDLLRRELMKDTWTLKSMYDNHAKFKPSVGLTQEEFKKMCPMARGVSFEASDIKLIFNALSSNPRRDVISLEDLQAWVNGACMVFI